MQKRKEKLKMPTAIHSARFKPFWHVSFTKDFALSTLYACLYPSESRKLGSSKDVNEAWKWYGMEWNEMDRPQLQTQDNTIVKVNDSTRHVNFGLSFYLPS